MNQQPCLKIPGIFMGREAGQLRERVRAEVNPTRLRDFRTLLTTQAPSSSAE